MVINDHCLGSVIKYPQDPKEFYKTRGSDTTRTHDFASSMYSKEEQAEDGRAQAEVECTSPEEVSSKMQGDFEEEYLNIANVSLYEKEETLYKRKELLGEGTYGKVYKAQSYSTGRMVALKELNIMKGEENLHETAFREVAILQKLSHENIVNLVDVCSLPSQQTISLVFELCHFDLEQVVDQLNLGLPDIKEIMKQLLSGMSYMHSQSFIHRDIKISNILLTRSGHIKIADFGLARDYQTPSSTKSNDYTPNLVTLEYRAPELLLGDKNYGPAVDMWSLGCILAELLAGDHVLLGHTEQHMLLLISELCGSITPDVWPEVVDLPLYNMLELPKGQPRQIHAVFAGFHMAEVELINSLLQLNPKARITADEALAHDFFYLSPRPSITSLKDSLSLLKAWSRKMR